MSTPSTASRPLSPAVRATSDLVPLHVVGTELRTLLSSADTGGAFALFELICPPGDGPPPHIHTREDETFIVLDGALEFLVGDDAGGFRSHTLTAGGCIFGPRGVPHTFRNPGAVNARVLVLATPGGFENFGAAVATRFPRGAAVDPLVLVGIMEAHGISPVRA